MRFVDHNAMSIVLDGSTECRKIWYHRSTISANFIFAESGGTIAVLKTNNDRNPGLRAL